MSSRRENKPNPSKSKRIEPTSNVEALECLIGFLRESGCVETVDLALIQGCRTLAAVLDENPSGMVAREYFTAIRELRGIANNEQDGFNDLVEQLRTASSDPEV